MFDSQTTLLLATALFLVLPMMKWLILPRQGSWAADMWCLGGLMAGVGIVLLGLRPKVPTVVSFHLANTLIIGCFVCSAQSLRMSLGQAWSAAGWTVRILLALLFYSALFEWASDAWRGVLFRFTLGVLGVYTAFWAWRLSRHIHSANAALIAGAHLVVGLSLMAHSVWTAGHIVDPSPFSNTWDASVISLVVLLMTVVTHVCYVGMVLDTAASDKLQAQQAQQAALQTQLLNTQLTHLDRHGRMAIVSGSLAHELNQPLTAATMNAQMAERQWAIAPAASPMLLSLLDQIEIGVERTVRILQRIRGENELVVQHHERVDLQAVLDRALEQMAPDCLRLSVQLMHKRSPRPLWCVGDGLGFSQVVINLLRNALQAMAKCPNRRLWLRCEAQNDRVLLVIRDAGPGMPDELIERWGQPFQSSRHEGMGLGLAISREIVTRHQGQLQLHNHPQGGLEVVLSMPAATGDAA